MTCCIEAPGRGRRKQTSYDVVMYVPEIAPLLAKNDIGSAGGAETQMFLVARALSARGVRVCICTFDRAGADIPERLDGIDIVLRSPYVRRGYAARFAEAVGLVRDVAGIDASVYLTRMAGFHVGLVALAALFRRRSFVYSAAHVADFAPRTLLPKLSERVLYRVGLSLADHVVVQTEEQAQIYRRYSGRNANIIRNIVEPGPERTASGEYFLWIARAIWYKGPLDYIALARAVPEAQFKAVCGPGERDDTAAIEEAAADVPNLELLKPRPRRDLMPLLDRAVAVVNTSVFEGMSNATLEGWARGVPSLTLAHDPDDLIQKHQLGWFADGSWDSFVFGARSLWSGRHDDCALRERCRAYVRAAHAPEALAEKWATGLKLLQTPRATSPVRAS